MPRLQRQLLSHSCYHIITRGNNRHDVFENDDDYMYFLDLIKRFKTEHPFDLFHYCLMSNHVHMLVKTNKDSDFSTFMKRLNLAYFHHYRNSYGWIGHFWQDRFKSQAVGKDEYFIQCGKYIELNPVRAGIVDTPEKYRYSSFGHYAEGKISLLITDNLFYETLGSTSIDRQKAYRELAINEIIENSYAKNVWGTAGQRYQETRKSKYNINK
jgi:putative transposase